MKVKNSVKNWLYCGLLLFASDVCLAQKPELVLQTGHTGEVLSSAFSQDGKTLATSGRDMVIKLWDVSTGKELRTLKGDTADVVSVAFRKDGKVLASGSYGIIRIWDVATGAELRTLTMDGHSKVTSVTFGPDGTLASGSWDRTIKLWDISTGTLLRTLRADAGYVEAVAFSPDGKTLASGSWDSSVRLWDVSTGAELSILTGHSSAVASVAFSNDGKILVSGSWDNTVKLWDISTGKEVRTLHGHSEKVNSVAFSGDGKTIASGSGDKTAKLWNASTGGELRTLKGQTLPVYTVSFSPDGKILASGGQHVKLWDVATATELSTLKGRAHTVVAVAISSDGRTLASASSDDKIRLWDLFAGTELRSLKEQSTSIYSLAFSSDGRTLATGSDDSTVTLWDVSTGKVLRTLKGNAPIITEVAFSGDSKILASSSANHSIKLWDVSTGAELRTLTGHTNIVTSVILSRDGKTLASGSYDNTVKLWNSATGAEMLTLKLRSLVAFVAFSPDEKTLASGGFDNTVTLSDVATGRELHTLKGHTNVIESVAFTDDGKILASGSQDKTVKLWDVSTGAELLTLTGHIGMIGSIAFSPNNKYLVSGSWDGSVKIWEWRSGRELASLITLDESDWIVVTPDGLFDGSSGAWRQLRWRFDNNTFSHAPVEAFFNEFYYPGLLQDIFQGIKPKPPDKDLSKIDIRQPNVGIASIDGKPATSESGSSTGNRTVKVKVNVTDNHDKARQATVNSPSGARDLRLFRNGSLVKVWHGDVLRGKDSVTLEATIPIVAGENNLTAYAFNGDNVKSSDAALTIKGADSLRRKGVAYILAIGVNEYANAQYNLTYAVPDATDFSEELKRQQEKLGNFDRVEVVPLNNKDATKANILKELAGLSAKIQPEDSLTIYFAGHGTAQQNRFYLIPHDLGYTGHRDGLSGAGLQTVLAHSISDEELEAAVEGIDAGHLLFVIDACNSGQALEAEEKRRGPMNSKGLAQLAYEKGMFILTAAQSYQAAKEAAKLGHGFLTYALVEEGLKTAAADREPKDGKVLLREWLNFATERVPQMQQEDFNTRELTREKNTPPGNPKNVRNDNLQRPRVFYRRETEPHPLVVARP